MTIVAGSIEAERIILIADCRVSFPDGSKHDALQKVYPFGINAVVAFAGSVGLASSALREVAKSNGKRSNPKLDKLTRRLGRIADRKARYLESKGKFNHACSFVVAGYSGKVPYLATVSVDGRHDPRIEVARQTGCHSVIGSGERERAACRNSIARGNLGKFSDDQAVWAFGGFIDGAMSLVSMPERFDEGIGDLKLHFVIRPEHWRFVPLHSEMFRGRIADRNKPLGYAPVHSVIWNGRTRRFLLKEHQSGSTYPLANALSSEPYELRGTVKADFDPYSLKA